MMKEEANICWGCNMYNRIGLDISYSLSHICLHNKPVILVLLSPFYKWRDWGLDRWWNVLNVTQRVSDRASIQWQSSFHYLILASLITGQQLKNDIKSLFYLLLYRDFHCSVFSLNLWEGWWQRGIFPDWCKKQTWPELHFEK